MVAAKQAGTSGVRVVDVTICLTRVFVVYTISPVCLLKNNPPSRQRRSLGFARCGVLRARVVNDWNVGQGVAHP